ncbi:MAG: anthranilate phosphoribosyltransferase [Promethearchaeota archaeon]
MITIKQAIHKKTVEKQNLSDSEAYAVMSQIMEGKATGAQIGAFLVAMKIRGESAGEVKAFVSCMKNHANTISPRVEKHMVDTCGTGGDTLKTANISTLSALVTAGSGVPVAKHGNRSVTSTCGSADILERVGVNIALEPHDVEKVIERAGIGFLFAPKFHPAMKYAIGPRREIGLRTVFNILGPLTNPASVEGQVLGVFSKEVSALMAEVLVGIGVKRFFIVHNDLGADELLPAGKNYVIRGVNGELDEMTLTAGDFGLPEVARGDLPISRTIEENERAFISTLDGRGPASLKSAVVMNSALAIITGDVTDDLKEAVRIATMSLETKAALAKLKELVQTSGGDVNSYNHLLGRS